MVDNKAPPKAFWVVAAVLFGGCCGATALLYAAAAFLPDWAQRQAFISGMRASMDLPAADEQRLAELAYEAMMSSGGMRAFDAEGAHGVADGARRVDDHAMLELHEVRTTLARASVPLCASMWSGVTDPDGVYVVVAQQPDEFVRSFFGVTFALLDASTAGGPLAMTEEDIATESEALFAAAIASRTPSAIATALELDAAADEAQQCAAMRELYDFISAQPEPSRTRYARALFCSMSPME